MSILTSYNLFWIKLCFKTFTDNLMHEFEKFLVDVYSSMWICFLLIWRVHPKNTQKAVASICYKRPNDGDPICGQSKGFPVPTSWIITSWLLT